MKKIISAILAIMMIATLSISAFAANQQLYIDELELELTISDEYDVITRDTLSDDPVFTKYGVTKGDLEARLFYFNAIMPDVSQEISIRMAEIASSDLSEYTFAEIENVYSNLKNTFETAGITVSAYEIYQSAQAKYIVLSLDDAMQDFHDLMYFTVVGGKEYYITMHSYIGEVTSNQEATLIEFVNNIKFDNVFTAPVVTEPAIEETEPVVDDYYEEDITEENGVGTETEKSLRVKTLLSSALATLGIGGLGLALLFGLPLLFFLVVVIVVIIIIVVVVKKKKKKKAAEAANAENSENIAKTE